MVRHRSIGERLKGAKTTEWKRKIMQDWSANIARRTEELIDLMQIAAENGELDMHREYAHELFGLIIRSMSAVPRITDILISTEPDNGE